MKSISVMTPIGRLKISEDNGYITQITFNGAKEEFCQHTFPLLEEAKKQLEEYFDGVRREFCLPLLFEGSDFTKAVLQQLVGVPYGQTVSYGQLAAMAGSPGAARAVGSVMRKNPFVIVVPCHRVLPADGSIGNYSAGGPANKDWLLTFEKQNDGSGLMGIFLGLNC